MKKKYIFKRIWEALCYRHGSFYAPYMWSNIFLFLAVIMWVEKLTEWGDIIVSDTQFLGTLGFIAAWESVFKVYNYFNEKECNQEGYKPKNKSEITQASD